MPTAEIRILDSVISTAVSRESAITPATPLSSGIAAVVILQSTINLEPT
jgi:hypothetical protein